MGMQTTAMLPHYIKNWEDTCTETDFESSQLSAQKLLDYSSQVNKCFRWLSTKFAYLPWFEML